MILKKLEINIGSCLMQRLLIILRITLRATATIIFLFTISGCFFGNATDQIDHTDNLLDEILRKAINSSIGIVDIHRVHLNNQLEELLNVYFSDLSDLHEEVDKLTSMGVYCNPINHSAYSCCYVVEYLRISDVSLFNKQYLGSQVNGMSFVLNKAADERLYANKTKYIGGAIRLLPKDYIPKIAVTIRCSGYNL